MDPFGYDNGGLLMPVSGSDMTMERPNRVTLKLDVSFTDHSHIIGKGGRSIQAVMNETACHIHFPDSNRTNTFEKSNQVSIAGLAQGVESARCRIRQLLPLTVYFDIPYSYFQPTAFDQTNPIIQAVQRNFSLVVSLKHVKEDHGLGGSKMLLGGFQAMATTLPMVRLAVRGTRAHVLGLRQGISILLDQLTGGMCSYASTQACIDTEVAAQHHPFLMGRGSCNIRQIQKATGALFEFPDNNKNTLLAIPAASSLPLKRSTVTITGPNFDSAFMAWQEMLGYVPLLLLFDLPDDQDINAHVVTHMMEQYRLSIIIKPKLKCQGKSIVIRGAERDSRLMFEARAKMLKLDQSEVPMCCEQHLYNTSNLVANLSTGLNSTIGAHHSLPASASCNSFMSELSIPSPMCSTPISQSRAQSPPLSRFWDHDAGLSLQEHSLANASREHDLSTMLESVLKRAFESPQREQVQPQERPQPPAPQQPELPPPAGYPKLGSSPASNWFADNYFKNLWSFEPKDLNSSSPDTPFTPTPLGEKGAFSF